MAAVIPGVRRRLPPRTHTVLAVVGLVASVIAYVTYTWDWRGLGFEIHAIVCTALLLVAGFCPFVLGARPKRLWALGSASAVFLILTIIRTGVIGDPDLSRHVQPPYFIAAVLLCITVIQLWRRWRPAERAPNVVGALSGVAGATLVIWTLAAAPAMSGADALGPFIAVVFPIMDLILLVVVANMAQRCDRASFAQITLIVTLSALLALDAVYATHRSLSPDLETRPYESAYVFIYYGFALALSHRSVGDGQRPTQLDIKRPGPFLVVISIAPILLSGVTPVVSPLDRIVRVLLVAVVLALTFIRLTITMVALSHSEGDSRWRATRDALTGLMNRPALQDHLTDLLAHNAQRDRFTAVVFLDCDDFKLVNDTWGHDAGDRVLTWVAKGLPAHLRPDDVLARHGGDEFVIAATVEQARDAEAIARRVQAFFTEPMTIAPGLLHRASSSMGVAVAAPTDDVSTSELLMRADLAMYAAKRVERGRYVVFDDTLTPRP